MSHSVKKTPIIKQACGDTKISKRFASKAARHCELSDGCQYKKAFDSYNIVDHISNLYRAYHSNGQPKKRWFAPLDAKLLREYYGK